MVASACLCLRMTILPFSYGKSAKARAASLAEALHSRGMLKPFGRCAVWIWRGAGRPLLFAKIAFWLNMLAEEHETSRAIVTFHAAAGRHASHRDWAARTRRILDDRSPVDPEAMREALPAGKPAGQSLDTDRLTYVLSGSLPQMRSGYAYRSHGLISALAAQGVTVTAVTRPGFPADMAHLAGSESPEASVCDVDGVVYHRIASPVRTGQSALSYIDTASRALEAFLSHQKPAAVMAASNHMNALPALMAARRLGLPFIYEVRGFWEITQASRDPAFLHSLRYNNAVALETLTAQEADRVMTLNQPMAEELVRRGVARGKIALIPNACDPGKYAPRNRDPDLARRLGINPQTLVIGFVGSFTIYEGLDDLVLACGILLRRGLDFKLVLVGDEVIYNKWQRPLMPHLRALVAQEQLEDHVHFAGRVPSAVVPQWYSLIDIAPFARKALAVSELVPPLKPVEAMAMSKTIIASDVGALQDFILDGQTGLMFPKGDIEAFADTLERVMRDVALRQTLGARARDWVVAQRSWAAVAQNLHRALKDIGGVMRETG